MQPRHDSPYESQHERRYEPERERYEPERERYETVLLDLDHTLLDSAASEVAAFDDTVRSVGLDPTPPLFQRYTAINRVLWEAVERGETTPVELRLTRFEQFVAAIRSDFGHTADLDPAEMAETFTTGLGNHGALYDGAEAMLEKLSTVARLAMITNGLSEVQRRRIERLKLDRFFDVFVISAEVGTSKPGTKIFDITFEQLGQPPRATTLMVGDSLTSDIQGGTNAGIDTCLYAPNLSHETLKSDSETPTSGPTPTHLIRSLDELIPVIGGR